MSFPPTDTPQNSRQPIFNLPWIIPALIGLMALIHFGRTIYSTQDSYLWVILQFAFISVRYTQNELLMIAPYAIYWSPITYSLLHGDWTHLIMNCLWLLAFGSVVARRLGTIRFLALFVIGAICGAGAHYMFHLESMVPMIGASASVSACMAAAIRLPSFSQANFKGDISTMKVRSLMETLTNRQALTFVGIWFAINLVFGAGLIDIAGEGQSIAWEAHIGGFLAGLFLFGLIDRIKSKN